MAAIDVVIPTHDRPASLARLLEDLTEQSRSPGRIVVVDDSAPSEPWEQRYPNLPLHVIRPSQRVFVSSAKNLGWRACGAPLVAFVDDDNRLPLDLLDVLASDLEGHSTWGAVMPGVLYASRPDLVWVYAAPFANDHRWSYRLLGRNAPRDPQLEQRILPTDALPNLSVIRREVLEAVGGFDERLPVNSSGDLCQRIKQNDWEVWADTSVLTYHDVEAPGQPMYWASHTLHDADRLRWEIADWLRFQRRWNPSRLFGPRAGYHSLHFLASHFVAVGGLAPTRLISHAAAAVGGFRQGLGPPSEPRNAKAS